MAHLATQALPGSTPALGAYEAQFEGICLLASKAAAKYKLLYDPAHGYLLDKAHLITQKCYDVFAELTRIQEELLSHQPLHQDPKTWLLIAWCGAKKAQMILRDCMKPREAELTLVSPFLEKAMELVLGGNYHLDDQLDFLERIKACYDRSWGSEVDINRKVMGQSQCTDTLLQGYLNRIEQLVVEPELNEGRLTECVKRVQGLTNSWHRGQLTPTQKHQYESSARYLLSREEILNSKARGEGNKRVQWIWQFRLTESDPSLSKVQSIPF